jgi:hypothetical protein
MEILPMLQDKLPSPHVMHCVQPNNEDSTATHLDLV